MFKSWFQGLVLCCLVVPAVVAEGGGTDSDRFIARARQLTLDGRRSGEGYFSADGSRMVFQSERESENPFYQIYELSFTTGESHRVSPGTGKTTCAFFRPGSREILFASTHHDPQSLALQRAEIEFRESGRERRYSWDYDPQMELYAAVPDGLPRRLTETLGYDAEGSYSPDGESIVFASNRQAFERTLSTDEQQKLEIDPAYFAELYVMPAGGGKPTRLTDAPGYDGGPFFSADGRRIVWRRFGEGGLTANLWSMNPDGSDPRQLTDFDSMSWAPYPHPSGEYLIFTTNKHGFENFELFLVDFAGQKEPLRVTFTDGFDGLPVFSPDGKQLSWTSMRGDGPGAQIWLARWDHDAALAALRKAPARKAPEEIKE